MCFGKRVRRRNPKPASFPKDPRLKLDLGLGPFTFPRPPTLWQVEHCLLPKKNCRPATALSAGFVSKADIFRDRTQRASEWISFSESGNAGMAPHVLQIR